MSYPNWIFSAFSFIGFLLVSIPFPWHLQSWNTGTCLFMAWTGVACLIHFINSIVWNGNAIDHAPVWCDITTRIMTGAAVAIPASSLCINRRLYHISCVKSVTHSRAERRQAVMVDLAIGISLPVLQMILQYIVQGHRYDIFEDYGCAEFTYNAWPAIVLVYLPPILIGLTSAVYCALSIRAFNKSRLQFKEVLSGNTNLKAGRFLRLMLLAGADIVCTVPFGSYLLYLNVSVGLVPWKSWKNVHNHFSEVDQFPAIIWKQIPILYTATELSRWLVVLCAFVFFGFFGFAEEARKNYRSALVSVSKRVGYTGSGSGVFSFNGSKSKTEMSMSDTSGSLPVHVHSEVRRKKDSIDSFSDMSVTLNDVGGALKSEKDSDCQDEEGRTPAPAYESIQLPNLVVSADYDPRPYSPPLSSGSSSSCLRSSIASPPEGHTCPPSPMLEIESLRRISDFGLPESSLVAPRHPIDAPSSVPRGSIDIV